MSRPFIKSPCLLASAIAGVATFNTAGLFAQTPPVKGPEPMPATSMVITPSTTYTAPPIDARRSATTAPLPAGSYELLNNGFRRVHRSDAITLSPEQLAEFRAAGKAGQLQGSTLTQQTFTDYLPENWLMNAADLPAGAQVDSYGNPIVNNAYALPGWAQQDVDALRQEIANWLVHLDNLDLALAGRADEITHVPPRATMQGYLRGEQDLQSDRQESQWILGNYVAQSFARLIDISDIMPLNHPRMTADVVESIAKYVRFYEGEKAQHAMLRGEAWPRGEYPSALVGLLAAHGHQMAELLAVPLPDEGGVAGAGDCYSNIPSAPGWTATVNGIGIWAGTTPVDDASVDIPIGFLCYYQPCEDGNANLNLRVSSNGYVGFYEQGAGQTPGTVFANTSLPSTADPDGIAAPHWDDLWITNQGTLDEVVYKLEGAVGNRVLTVEYWSVSHLSGGTSEFYYFQVKLLENSSQVQFHYDIFNPDPTVDSRTVGIENYSGTGATCGGSCSNAITGAPANNYLFRLPGGGFDSCASAVCLPGNGVYAGDNFGATGTALCALNDFADVWYSFTASTTGSVTVSTCSLVWFDTSLAVYTACGGTAIACNDDSCGLRSSITFAATAGQTYLVRVAGFNGQRGLFELTISGSPAGGGAGTECASCIPVAGSSVLVNGNTANNGVCDAPSDWYCWTPPTSGTYRVTTCGGVTDFDTILEVLGGANCGALTTLAINDDTAESACDLPTASFYASRVLWNFDAGTPYKVRVRGFGGASGPYTLTITPESCSADVSPLYAGDHIVNIDDLLAVIGGWGACVECRADFIPAGGNNQVNIDDLLAVIGAWGACP